MSKTAWIAGDPKMVCDVCGFEYRRSEMRKRWDGAMVCKADFELRHPQEFPRVARDQQAVKDARPEPETVLSDNYPFLVDENGDDITDGTGFFGGEPIAVTG